MHLRRLRICRAEEAMDGVLGLRIVCIRMSDVGKSGVPMRRSQLGSSAKGIPPIDVCQQSDAFLEGNLGIEPPRFNDLSLASMLYIISRASLIMTLGRVDPYYPQSNE